MVVIIKLISHYIDQLLHTPAIYVPVIMLMCYFSVRYEHLNWKILSGSIVVMISHPYVICQNSIVHFKYVQVYYTSIMYYNNAVKKCTYPLTQQVLRLHAIEIKAQVRSGVGKCFL